MSVQLINKLARELSRAEIQQIVQNFIDALVENNPDLVEINSKQIAEYLVNGQPEDDKRLTAILFFLAAAETLSDQTSDLFGYLLHTLVKCDDKNGFISLPVSERQTVQLIDAAQKGISLIPDYNKEHQEHKNGTRNSRFEDVSDFVPESGLGDPVAICQKMAFELLVAIGDQKFINPNGQTKNWSEIWEEILNGKLDPLKILSGRIVSNPINPLDSPLQYILIDKEKFPNHPLSVPEILEIFLEKTKKRLPIYAYGANNPSSAEDWLHVPEVDIYGILVGKTVDNYHKNNLRRFIPIEDLEMKPKEKPSVEYHIYGPNNGVLNIAGNDQKNLQTTHITQQNDPQYIEQLHQLLTKVLQEADKQNEINKTQFAELSKIVDQIQTELQKKQSADSGLLSKAKTALEAFKNIASIAGSINAIIALLP